jgi:hypothetical protein
LTILGGGTVLVRSSWAPGKLGRGNTDSEVDVKRLVRADPSVFWLCCFSAWGHADLAFDSTPSASPPLSLPTLCVAFESLWGHYVQTGLCARTSCASLLLHSGQRQGAHRTIRSSISGGKRNQRSFVWASRTWGVRSLLRAFSCVLCEGLTAKNIVLGGGACGTIHVCVATKWRPSLDGCGVDLNHTRGLFSVRR